MLRISFRNAARREGARSDFQSNHRRLDAVLWQRRRLLSAPLSHLFSRSIFVNNFAFGGEKFCGDFEAEKRWREKCFRESLRMRFGEMKIFEFSTNFRNLNF